MAMDWGWMAKKARLGRLSEATCKVTAGNGPGLFFCQALQDKPGFLAVKAHAVTGKNMAMDWGWMAKKARLGRLSEATCKVTAGNGPGLYFCQAPQDKPGFLPVTALIMKIFLQNIAFFCKSAKLSSVATIFIYK
ncbi:MAG: hypothetical protein IKA65_02525 [Lentisphaeria bacterium]|nr:hypothetical protein [Lentisphaeria bacterium]